MDDDLNGIHEITNIDAASCASGDTAPSKNESPIHAGPEDDDLISKASEYERVQGVGTVSSSGSLPGTPSKTLSTHEEKADSKRKFRILGLRQPGEWRKNEKLWELFTRSEQCHIWFDAAKQVGGVKHGGASLTYDTIEAARAAFQDAQKIQIDGQIVKLQASQSFYDPIRAISRQFSVPSEESIRSRTVYALNLIKNANMDVLKSIFVEVERLEIIPQTSEYNQAEVLLRCSSVDEVQSIVQDADGFSVNDGDQESVLKVLSAAQYVEWAKQASKPQRLVVSSHPHRPPLSSHSLTSHPSSTPRLRTSSSTTSSRSLLHSPLSEAPPLQDVVAAFNNFVEQSNLNWAEINEKEGLYEICDKISEQLGGLPDSLLKAALLAHLEAFMQSGKAESAWMRRHLESLIKTWKGEVKRDALFERPTRIPLQSRQITALPVESKRSRSKGVLRALMGIGAVLGAARAKFATEEGELDIDEDDAGNFSIGGESLSFDSWAKLSKASNQQRVIVAAEPRKRAGEEKKQEKAVNRKVKRAKMEEDKKKLKEDAAAKELEEGEMDSDEEKRARSAGSASSSTTSSSSDSEDNEAGPDSRRRRRNRRKADRKQPSALPNFFVNLYDNRVSIIAGLSNDHKKAFSDILSQIIAKKNDFTTMQQRDMFANLQNAFGQGPSKF